MAVPEQTPYSEHTGNGVTKSFALNFDCESKDYLIVLVGEIEPPIATWSLIGGNVVFTTAPISGSKITIQRNTPFSRSVDYQSYNNSFRPQTVNGDFDRLWLKLQELGVADWLMKLYVDRLHQQQEVKIKDLKDYVDDRDDELRSYLMEEIRKQGVALDQLDDYYNYLMQRLAQIAVDKGWDASFVTYSGVTQERINDGLESIADMLAIENPKDGMRAHVNGFHTGTKIGGGDFKYNAARSSVNDSCLCFYGWERLNVSEIDITMSGALADGTGRLLSDLYSTSEYTLIYPNYVDTEATIDTIAYRAASKCVYDSQQSVFNAFTGSSTLHIKPVGKYVFNKMSILWNNLTKAYDSQITKKSGYNGVLFYTSYPYQYEWDGGIFSGDEGETGAIWWLGAVDDTVFNIDQSRLNFHDFQAWGFRDVFAKFNSQSCFGSIKDWRICKCTHVIGNGLTLDESTGLYTSFEPKDFALQTNFRTPDMLEVSSGWLETGAKFSQDLDALFYSSSMTTFKDILGVPLPHDVGTDIAFCNVQRTALFDNVRPGGEDGSFALVNFFGTNVTPYPYEPSVLSLSNMSVVGMNSSSLKYRLAENINGNQQLTLKLNTVAGLPSKGYMQLGQFFVYDSINTATNTLNLVTPVIANGSIGDEVVNSTARCFVRLITGAPSLLKLTGMHHGVEVGSLIGYSAYSNMSNVESEFVDTVFTLESSNLLRLYQSGFGLPPVLFNVNKDKHTRMMIENLYLKPYVHKASLSGALTTSFTLYSYSVFDSLKLRIKVTPSGSTSSTGIYEVDLTKFHTVADGFDLVGYNPKLTTISDSNQKVTSVVVDKFISTYGNSQRPSPMWIRNEWTFSPVFLITFDAAFSGDIAVSVI